MIRLARGGEWWGGVGSIIGRTCSGVSAVRGVVPERLRGAQLGRRARLDHGLVVSATVPAASASVKPPPAVEPTAAVEPAAVEAPRRDPATARPPVEPPHPLVTQLPPAAPPLVLRG